MTQARGRRIQKPSRSGGGLCRGLTVGAISVGLVALSVVGPADAQRLPSPAVYPNKTLPRRPSSPPVDTHAPFLMRADEVSYDRDSDTVTASGHVEISQGQRIVLADRVSYNRKTATVTVAGNITMLEPTGDVYFADYAELSDDLRDATIENFRGLLIDNSRLAASVATRTGAAREDMTKMVFSPCNLCKDDPTRAPLWQLKGEQVSHDDTTHDFIYHDATLELFGVPVLYAPYFSHPDPTVKRRSGLLPPIIGYSSTLGGVFGMPYFGVIDPSSDFTVEPRIYTQEGPWLGGEYRKRFDNGTLRLAATGIDAHKVEGTTILSDRGFRGNLVGDGQFDINENWRGGFDLSRASDQTYIQRFKLGQTFSEVGRFFQPNFLTSDAWIERFGSRDYFSAAAYDFQNQSTSINSKTVARVHPYSQFTATSDADAIGGRFRLDGNILSVSRDVGFDSNRLATVSGYYLPTISSDGSVWNFAATVENDGYSVSKVPTNIPGQNFSGSTGRSFPQLAAIWSYPLSSRLTNSSLLLEPKMGVFAGPNGGNPAKIPNEDSQGFEFDESHLFAIRRYPGYDIISTGQRVDYGLRGAIYGDHQGSAGFLIGQSVRARRDDTIGTDVGLNNHVSDIVGRINVQPQQWVDFTYRFRLANNELRANRQEVGTTFFGRGASLSINYVAFSSLAPNNTTVTTTGLTRPKTLQAAATTPIADQWSLYGNYIRDVQAGQSLTEGIGVLYRDECFGIALTYERNNFTELDVKPGTTVMLRLGFKYLGDFGT
jgi:LPS-assembly protein